MIDELKEIRIHMLMIAIIGLLVYHWMFLSPYLWESPLWHTVRSLWLSCSW